MTIKGYQTAALLLLYGMMVEYIASAALLVINIMMAGSYLLPAVLKPLAMGAWNEPSKELRTTAHRCNCWDADACERSSRVLSQHAICMGSTVS